jgi:hypothetical protein
MLAIHCENTAGGAWLDAGLSEEPPGNEEESTTAAKQESVDMNATQTIYTFTCGAVRLQVTFTSPLIVNDLDILANPVSYISFKTSATDAVLHNVDVYFGASTNLAVNEQWQPVSLQHYYSGNLTLLKAGTLQQPVLQKKGDDLRIDW